MSSSVSSLGILFTHTAGFGGRVQVAASAIAGGGVLVTVI